MIGQCRFCSTNQIKAFRSKETWRNWVKKTIYVSFYLIFKQNSSNFPIFTAKTRAIMQYICVTATRDEIRELSFATKWFADLCFTENDRIYRTTELSLQYSLLVIKDLLKAE